MLTRLKSALVQGYEAWNGKTIQLTDGGFWGSFFGLSNFSGQRVSVNSALQLSTVWGCVRLVSETLSTLPCNLLRDRNGVAAVDSTHSLHYLLHTQPNAETTAVTFWQAFIASMLLWPGAYVEVDRNVLGTPTSLWNLLPQYVERKVIDGRVRWWYTDPDTNNRREITEKMWYTPAFSLDGKTGLSPVSMGANVFGGAIAADRASADTFTKGMKATGIVNVDHLLTPKQREETRDHVRTVSEKGGYFVLEKGTGFQQLNMNPQDAELLSTRAFNVEEICRWFRVPPFMVGHSEKSTSWGTGIEQQMIGFITFVLRPWAVRIEQSIRMNLLSPAERSQYSAQFVLEGLLRGDSASRAAFYNIMVQNGIYTRDECRAKENLAPHGGNAEVLTVQSNLVPIDKLGTAAASPAKPLEDALKNFLGITDNSAVGKDAK